MLHEDQLTDRQTDRHGEAHRGIFQFRTLDAPQKKNALHVYFNETNIMTEGNQVN
jgi:hypothetical protein